VVLLHQGAVGGFDVSSFGGRGHAQHAIGISREIGREIGSSQGNASTSDTALQATLGTQAAKLASIVAQQKTPA
jgi:hypothetical protein